MSSVKNGLWLVMCGPLLAACDDYPGRTVYLTGDVSSRDATLWVAETCVGRMVPLGSDLSKGVIA